MGTATEIILNVYLIGCFEEKWKYICIFDNYFDRTEIARLIEILPHLKTRSFYVISTVAFGVVMAQGKTVSTAMALT